MNKNLKKGILIGIIGTMILFTTGCSSCERWRKDVGSDFSGGIDRTVYVYDVTGNLLKTYTGKIDIDGNTTDNKVKFDISDDNNRRVIIYNAIVIVEEN